MTVSLGLGGAASSARLNPLRVASNAFRALAFQNQKRASVNVRSHYDIPQTALNVYLDRRYMSYSCGMWEEPERRDCVKVEDPDAEPPKPSVNRKPKPHHPIARPLPAAGGHQAR